MSLVLAQERLRQVARMHPDTGEPLVVRRTVPYEEDEDEVDGDDSEEDEVDGDDSEEDEVEEEEEEEEKKKKKKNDDGG
jgi:hypothetical protein